MKYITKTTLIAAGVMAALTGNLAWAANVPAGVQLADKQELVKGNGAEPQSLDPHKIEGVTESNINRDILEGLAVADTDGKVIPGVAESWESKEGGKVWIFHLRDTA